MTVLIVVLLALILLAALWLVFRPQAGGGGANESQLRAALADSDSRQRQEQQAALTAQLAPINSALNAVQAGFVEGREQTLRQLAGQQTVLTEKLHEGLSAGRKEQADRLIEFQSLLLGSLRDARQEQTETLGKLQEQIKQQLTKLQESNEMRLEEMRKTVDEKLQTTLEKRLGDAFQRISENLEKVQHGLGEMKSLAADVGGLKRVLSGIKTRGVFGEAQLGALLEQFLAPGQFEKNVKVRPRSDVMVEYAVKLPGPEAGHHVWLPIDAKFPLEDYQRLMDAYEAGDALALETSAKALEQRIFDQARDIRDKYIAPPGTTDFALLFLPYEGLYAEALRRPGLLEKIQRDCKVTFVGPTTLTAFLNSLQVGFRTLAISKQSGEVWKYLGNVKYEFGKFGEALTSVQKKLDEASSKLGEVSERKEMMIKKLGKVESLPSLPGPDLAALPLSLEAGDDEDDESPA